MWEELRAFSGQAAGTTNLCIYPEAPPTPYFLHAMASPAHGCTPVTEIFTLGFAFIGVILSAKNDQELKSVFTHPHLLCCWAIFFQLKGRPAKEIHQLLKLVLTRSVSITASASAASSGSKTVQKPIKHRLSPFTYSPHRCQCDTIISIFFRWPLVRISPFWTAFSFRVIIKNHPQKPPQIKRFSAPKDALYLTNRIQSQSTYSRGLRHVLI